jgi:hypothetical protein
MFMDVLRGVFLVPLSMFIILFGIAAISVIQIPRQLTKKGARYICADAVPHLPLVFTYNLFIAFSVMFIIFGTGMLFDSFTYFGLTFGWRFMLTSIAMLALYPVHVHAKPYYSRIFLRIDRDSETI